MKILHWGDMGKCFKTEPYDRYNFMVFSFAQYIRGEKTNPYTLDYELELYKTILKACGK